MNIENIEVDSNKDINIYRSLYSEFIGSWFLVTTIIGSGIMGSNLSDDDGIALLGNTIATWGILYSMISVLDPISGAHFNPLVSLAFRIKGDLNTKELILYILCQTSGCISGAYTAHGMFMIRNGEFEGKNRNTDGEMLSEIITTFGLLLTIFGGIKGKKDVPLLVGLYISAGYWFSSSTSFANPAVTIARSFTDTFASISPNSLLKYLVGQSIGFMVGFPMCIWLFQIKIEREK